MRRQVPLKVDWTTLLCWWITNGQFASEINWKLQPESENIFLYSVERMMFWHQLNKINNNLDYVHLTVDPQWALPTWLLKWKSKVKMALYSRNVLVGGLAWRWFDAHFRLKRPYFVFIQCVFNRAKYYVIKWVLEAVTKFLPFEFDLLVRYDASAIKEM